jgi:hypothetical protein
MGVGMARIAAAYIANGAPRIRGRAARRYHAAQGGEALAWKRIYCLFRLLKAFDNPDDPVQLVLIADNEPPQVDDLLMGPLIEKLGVEIRVLDFFWRSEAEPERPDFFLFDALENLSATMDMDDSVLLFSSEAHVVQGLAELYAELDHLSGRGSSHSESAKCPLRCRWHDGREYASSRPVRHNRVAAKDADQSGDAEKHAALSSQRCLLIGARRSARRCHVAIGL